MHTRKEAMKDKVPFRTKEDLEILIVVAFIIFSMLAWTCFVASIVESIFGKGLVSSLILVVFILFGWMVIMNLLAPKEGGYMDKDIVTIEDCIEMQEKKGCSVILENGKVQGFTEKEGR